LEHLLELDWMAFASTLGFTISISAAIAMLYTVATGERGATVRLRRRLGPSPDLPDLLPQNDAVAELVAHGLTPLARLAKPLKEDELEAVRGQLSHAGFRSPNAMPIFLASKVLASLLLTGIVLWVNAIRVEPTRMLSAWAICAAGFGFFLPNQWLRSRIKTRQTALNRALPDALDLLVTCVEAGLGLDAALQRVAGELILSHPILSEELTLTFLETKAGFARTEAFRRLADRTGVQDLKTLAATLSQTDLFGTSVATALRVQAEGLRVLRMHRAEERAATLSVKMTFPLVVCFLPALLVVILGPAMVNLGEAFTLGMRR
jgi:tight adherence protein C